MHTTLRSLSLAVLVAAIGCGGDDTGATGGTGGVGGVGGSAGRPSGPPRMLSEWNLFADIPGQVPATGLVPYEVTSPLFSDYAAKFRFVKVPEGGKLTYSNDRRWESPNGTIYVKTFAYPIDERNLALGYKLIETRLLIITDDGSKTYTYVYPQDDPSYADAEYILWGPTIPVSWVNSAGDTVSIEYEVPTEGSCRNCHGAFPDTRTLGPSTGMFNRDNDYGGSVGVINQIDHLNNLGLLDIEPPAPSERPAFVDGVANTGAGLHERARSYFESNCSNCHASDGEISAKGLFLDYDSLEPAGSPRFQDWGVCKTPSSAGNGLDCEQPYGIVPGNPDESLLVCRMESVAPGERMAPIGRTIPHAEAVALVREWITELPNIFPGIRTSCDGS